MLHSILRSPVQCVRLHTWRRNNSAFINTYFARRFLSHTRKQTKQALLKFSRGAVSYKTMFLFPVVHVLFGLVEILCGICVKFTVLIIIKDQNFDLPTILGCNIQNYIQFLIIRNERTGQRLVKGSLRILFGAGSGQRINTANRCCQLNTAMLQRLCGGEPCAVTWLGRLHSQHEFQQAMSVT